MNLEDFNNLKPGDILQTVHGIGAFRHHQIRPWDKNKGRDARVTTGHVTTTIPRSRITRKLMDVKDVCNYDCIVLSTCRKADHAVECFYEKNQDFYLPKKFIARFIFTNIHPGDVLDVRLNSHKNKAVVVIKHGGTCLSCMDVSKTKHLIYRKQIVKIVSTYRARCLHCVSKKDCLNHVERMVDCWFKVMKPRRGKPKLSTR